jgi:dTDP-4-dehydrorhamnose 3,5-epimerase-like enzyme
MSIIKLIQFTSHGDHRGELISLEQHNNIPFEVKRVYYLFNTSEREARGFHAHITLKQVAVCVSGSCRVVLDDGKKKEDVVLDSPFKGLYIDSMIWREMYDFSPDCVLMVIASELYDEEDYIRDYDHFLKQTRFQS